MVGVQMWQNSGRIYGGHHLQMTFIRELKRRNVFRVGIAYVLISWVLLQGSDFILDLIGAPNWVIQVLFLLVAIGLPAVLIFAWVFEVTPQGIRRESEVDPNQSITAATGSKLNTIITVFLFLAVVVLLADKFMSPVVQQAGKNAPVPAEHSAPATETGNTGSSASSIAVLPFVNMSADAEQEYFSDGITEEVINSLVRVPGLKVAARTSVFAFKGTKKDVREIGSELNVSHVLEGSVRSDGEQLRITAQLIQVDDGFHVWSETYDRERVNVFAIQEEIAGSITEVLEVELGPSGTGRQQARIDIGTYEDYLRGRSLLRERSDQSLQQAVELFRSVVSKFPDYAPAWAGLAMTADVMDDHEEAEKAAKLALELDPDNVDALNALGAVYRDMSRWIEAETLLLRAQAIDPGSAELLEDIAEFWAGTGRVKKQLEAGERGYAIDPYLNPLISVYAQALMSNGQPAKAIEILDRFSAVDALRWSPVIKLVALSQLGDEELFRTHLAGLDLPEKDRLAALNALDHPTDPAALSVLAPSRVFVGVGPEQLSGFVDEIVLLHVGHPGPVIESYLSVLSKKGWISTENWFLPLYAPFRTHPKFEQLLEAVQLPEYWDQTGWPEFCRRADDGGIVCH